MSDVVEGTISITLDAAATEFMPLRDVVRSVEQTYARYVLASSGGNRPLARERLGVSASTLCRILAQDAPKAHHVLRIHTRSQYQQEAVAIHEQAFMESIPDPNAMATCLLRFFGVEVKREALWRKAKDQLEWLLDEARFNYLRLAKLNHPDGSGAWNNARMAQINQCWARLETIFGNHGVRRRA